MIRLVTALVFLLISSYAGAQLSDPTEWTTTVEKISDKEYSLKSTAILEDGWHMYSQIPVDAFPSPIPTQFKYYDQPDNYSLVGPTNESGTYAEYSDIWGADVYQFDNKAVFTQNIELINEQLDYIIAEVEFMVCDDERCLPASPEVLIFKLKPNVVVGEDASLIIDTYYDNDLSPTIAQIPTLEETISKKEQDEDTSNVSQTDIKDDDGLATIFILCLLAGFGALLTPCVYPMIPMTVSFFTKQSENSSKGKLSGLMYGVFILLIYVACSLPFHLFESVSPDVFNEFSTNPYVNIFFFLIFVVFAISFFGAFEITVPNSWVNKVDGASNIGGVIGVFFMALTLVLVSFSCTGPVIGAVLGSVLTSDGGATALSVGLAGFGIGLGIPFAFFAIFPSYLNKLPKSGGWLNTVKVFLGFLELAFAFKFLSNADLVWQAGLLEREVFIAIWIAIFGVMAFYLLGKIRLPHDDKDSFISVGRLLLGILALCFTLYLIPGLWGAPLKLISGFPPPMTYSESPYGLGVSSNTAEIELPEGAHFTVHNLIAFDDYEAGLAYASKVSKPALIDFTGWACVNCRKMEERVWSNDEVLQILKNEVVLISLYVDEQKKLAKEDQYESQTTGKKIRTVGNRWSDLQIEKYQVNAQPFYVIVDSNGGNLTDPIGYTPDAVEYRDWLLKAIE
ncbi:protein-disulfide reductase DsbD family protein [Nonlabens ponticola]|uniref:Thiol:disulfide interchange protein n=1 Tax=Nonlabens ponticola TaxID=2496866 RepID=A0A3S9N062_9FLAO|nr:cytochrome c biogenesis protein CcdA [Nonlabens ponticola]AZQ44712.1 thiol:disulfide interchange protein [Nonlabens ponticola]